MQCMRVLGMGGVIVLSASCSDFLDEKPRNSISQEEAYGSVDGLLNNAVLAIYNHVGGNADSQGLQGTNRGVFDLNSLSTDEAIMPTRGGDWYDGGFWQRLFTHAWNADEGAYLHTWEYLYKVVMLCNDYLQRVDDYERHHPEDEAILQSYKAELRGVRAMYYFYLIDLFGNVPLITSTQVPSDSVKQMPRPQVYRYIVDELQEVLPLLSAETALENKDYYGRFTRGVGEFLLAKLMLNAQVYSDEDWTDGVHPDGRNIYFNVEGQEMNAWEATVYYCDALGEKYDLQPDFSYNFSVENEQSIENIFTIPMDPIRYSNWYNYFFRSRHYAHGAALGGGSENGTSATIELLDAFGYDTPQEDERFDMTFYAGVVEEDGKTVMMDDGVTPLEYHPRQVKLVLTGSPYITTAGARWKKYEKDVNANADGRACHNDIVLFRYADALLMKAEALVRNGEDGTAPLNRVQQRSHQAGDEVATLDNIYRERFIELAWEGWRRNDMVRFSRFTRSYTDRPRLEHEASGYTTVFPIPTQLLMLHPGWKQNKGY